MRKLIAVALVGALGLSALPSAALAGDPHAVRDRWAGAAIGAGVAVAGAVILNALTGGAAAVAAPPTPVLHAPPPVVYPGPPVVYAPPPVVYAPPVVVHRPPIIVHRPPVIVHRPPVVHRYPVPPGYWHRGYDRGHRNDHDRWQRPYDRSRDRDDWRRHR